MSKPLASILIFQILLAGFVTSAHSVELSHDKNDGSHFHFLETHHDHDCSESEQEHGAHFHFSLFMPLGKFDQVVPPGKAVWVSDRPASLASRSYSPPVPPPNPLV